MESIIQKPQEALVDQPRGNSAHILKEFPKKKAFSKSNMSLIAGCLLVVLAGVVTGWFLSGGVSGSAPPQTALEVTGVGESKTEAGVEDVSGLNEAEGILKVGGIEGEGTYHLERNGGPSKYVYLTSTVVDLTPFVDKKVHIWGETLSAVKAPWLMDVAKIKLVE